MKAEITKALNAASQNNNKHLRNAALVFLHYDEQFTFEDLAKVCTLARATIATYVRKFKNLLEWARKEFTTVHKKFNRKISRTTKFWVYIDKITFKDGAVWCKIGQTSQTPEKRAHQIKKTGWQDGTLKPEKIEVCWFAECKDEAATEIMENVLRIAMIKLNPSKFLKNDRLTIWEDDYPERIANNELVILEGRTYFKTQPI